LEHWAFGLSGGFSVDIAIVEQVCVAIDAVAANAS
jgi:hypothetical protein